MQENKTLNREREVLTQKLGRSKTALQETLLRLSKSNLQKQDQVSPGVTRRPPSRDQGSPGVSRRPPSRLLSDGVATAERETSVGVETNKFGAKPKLCTLTKSKSTI